MLLDGCIVARHEPAQLKCERSAVRPAMSTVPVAATDLHGLVDKVAPFKRSAESVRSRAQRNARAPT